MRKVLLFLGVIALVIAAVAVFLFATTPRESAGIASPLTPRHRSLLEHVPADAELFALIPTAAGVDAKLRANPITAGLIDEWSQGRTLPQPWMLGGADLVVWRTRAGTSFAFRLDGLRAMLVRAYVAFQESDVRVEGSTFFVGPPAGETKLVSIEPGLFLERANGLTGDALVVQRVADGLFPPIDRPAVSSITVSAREIRIVSRAGRERGPAAQPVVPVLPRGGIMSAWFAEPTRVVTALDRLLPGDLSSMLSAGGSLVLYDVDMRRLLPRPRGLFIVPDTPATQSAADRLGSVAELVGGVERRDGKILIAVDRESLPAYATEAFAPLSSPANLWAARIDPARMHPVAERLADHRGLRFAAPELQRSARNLRDWLGKLSGARSVEAAAVARGGTEELRVLVTAK